MASSYSANRELGTLSGLLGFEKYFFDDPSIGPKIKLRDRNKDAEIDAVLVYKNLVCVIAVYSGRRDPAAERYKFFLKMDGIDSVESLRLHLKVTARSENTPEVKDMVSRAEILRDSLSAKIKSIKDSSNPPILRKIFFCPNSQLGPEGLAGKTGRSIDKDAYEYFLEVSERLDRAYLLRDFLHFLDIRKVDLETIGPAVAKAPGRSRPHLPTSRLPIEKNRIIMYSLPATVEELENYVTVLRIAQRYDSRGFQRMVDPKRLKRINAEYLTTNETFPNNVIMALNPKVYTSEPYFYTRKNGFTFLEEYNSLILIDGQHRFFALYTGGKKNRSLLVTLLYFKSGTLNKKYLSMYKMFYEINKKQQKIDPNLGFELLARMYPKSPERFWYDVFVKLKDHSVFDNKYSFMETTLRKKLERGKKSIVSVLRYGGILGLNDPMVKRKISYPGLGRFYPEKRADRITFALNLFKNYFDVIERVLFGQGVKKSDLKPREIGALLRLMRHFIVQQPDYVKLFGSVRRVCSSRIEGDRRVVGYFESELKAIDFGQLARSGLASSKWAAVEGIMLAQIHKSDKAFGDPNLLSKRGRESYKQVMEAADAKSRIPYVKPQLSQTS